jgi:hypothetical protein
LSYHYIWYIVKRYSTLSVEESNVNYEVFDSNQEHLDTIYNTLKSILPPPVFVKGVKDYIGLRNSIIVTIGLNSFSCKSTLLHLKIQTDTPDNYRNLINILKNIEAQFHTYQLQSDKVLRIVIRNLHPSIPISDIASALKDIGYTVKNVTYVIHQQTKISLPLFFVDIDSIWNNSYIFDNYSLLHTKIKIEEPHKKDKFYNVKTAKTAKTMAIPAHTVHIEPCVLWGNHPFSTCTKSTDLPAKCTLCNGSHPANYKGCTIYKQLSLIY